ncbi:MAG: PilT/PilU family type 4a pilus ATPase [Candidatus Gracilibacteria bacterium]|nr:PilT/PilU family type 4a pilus ATPase [Candidatus Gracilibacteria bacterium]MDD4530065.1 PilT/PilU family type 4a pilus ATPase [Candidatus Gracilibacteria bacterium]
MILEKFQNLLREIIEAKIPDLHITTGQTPYVRKHNGEVEELTSFGIISKEEMNDIVADIVRERLVHKLKEELELDCSYIVDGTRFRVNIFQDTKGYSIAFRYISKETPTLEQIGLGETITNLLDKQKGLIFVTGPTGSGKSTTLAAMVDYINNKYKKHVITIEDPIEFVFENKLCHINQREVGLHTNSFARAIKSTLREDPDVILVGEMRDPETMQAALTLAETGHMVLSTLHTNDAVQTVDRIVDSFPEGSRDQIRSQLGMALSGIISQVLVPKVDGNGRVAAREIVINTDPIRNLITRGITIQMYSIVEISAKEGMILMDKSLMELYNKGIITKEACQSRLRDKDYLKMMKN